MSMQWNTNAFVGTILVVSLIIISIIKPGGAIEEKITFNGKLDARKVYNTLGISMTICLLNGGLILYAGDQRPVLLILAIIIFALDISLTIRYVNSHMFREEIFYCYFKNYFCSFLACSDFGSHVNSTPSLRNSRIST